MKKLLIFSVIAFSFVFASSVSAVAPNWNVTGTWIAQHEFGGNFYTHANNIVQASDGTLTGTGGWNGMQNNILVGTPNTWVIDSGSLVSGDTIHFNYHYTSVETCALNGYVDAVIAVDGSMTGTWHDDCNGGRTGAWTVVSGTAIKNELCPEGYLQETASWQTLTIDCKTGAKISSNSLTNSIPYILEASGTCNWRTPGSSAGYLADADYWLRHDAYGNGWTKMNPGSIAFWNGTSAVNIDWGNFSSTNIYPIVYTPSADGQVTFYFYDDVYSDNSGSLNVNIYKCAPICQPTTEVCDGIDNDCDGLIDEDLTAPSQSCSAGLGACKATGTQIKTCNGLSGWSDWGTCSAVPGTPITELCNAIDDDCDGVADEDNVCMWKCSSTNNDYITLEPEFLSLGTNRWIYTGSAWLKGAIKGGGTGPTFVPTLADTHNCSCSQILTWLHTNLPDQYGEMNGHWKYGCSQSAIQDFIRLADEAPILTGQWLLSVNGGAYMHDMFILTQDETGALTGKGGYPAGSGPTYPSPYNWTMTGSLVGNVINMTIQYQSSYSASISGTVNPSFDYMSGGAGTGGVISWSATRI